MNFFKLKNKTKSLCTISYDKIKRELQNDIDELNEKCKKISEKYGKKFNKITFSGLIK